ncbi:MAG TPA: DUF1269 domain-containing protein [Candidatus Binatus sp.]|nr:DUF1269 domain-containing protein [Candidatus Binatus sp.]
MEKILIAVFDTDKAAYDGLTSLKDLHKDGEISLYASSVVAKNAAGEVTVEKTPEPGPIGTLVGIVGGSLVGLLGGPAGVLVGAYVGGTGGLMYDLFTVGVGVDLMDQVAGTLTPGKVALVADLDETWITPVDTRLEALGATIFRRSTGGMIDDQILSDAQAAAAEMDQLDAELRQASADRKARIEAQITAERAKLESIVTRADTSIQQSTDELEARSAALRTQLASARSEQHQRIVARIDEAKAKSRARREKLHKARELASEALAEAGEALKV